MSIEPPDHLSAEIEQPERESQTEMVKDDDIERTIQRENDGISWQCDAYLGDCLSLEYKRRG